METNSADLKGPRRTAELSYHEVADWLDQSGFSRTRAAFAEDVAEAIARGQQPDDFNAEAQVTSKAALMCEVKAVKKASLEAELRVELLEALSAYQQLAGQDGLHSLLEQGCASLRHHPSQQAGVDDSALRPEYDNKLQTLKDINARLRERERQLEAQQRQTIAIVAERMQTLVTSIDPMRKNILLPLLRSVALLGSSSTVRAAARHMMLTLYKRPMAEHRVAIAQEWLRVARETPSRSLEQEVIPELYTLVNAQAFERRLLALDCVAAVAPLLRRSPQIRYSLCQGLLRPLCEDETSAVRRELPRCFSLLWGDTSTTEAELDGTSKAKGGSGLVQQTATDSQVAAYVSDDGNTPESGFSLSPMQKKIVMELLVRLATDTNSFSVRQAAQTQLCEVLYPVFLREALLLTQFVPLLLTVIGMESSQMLLLKRTGKSSASQAPPDDSTSAVSAKEGRMRAAGESAASVAAAVSLNNVMTLIQLLHVAFRCVAADVLHHREAGERCSTIGEDGGAATSPSHTYVHVVLPTALHWLPQLLSRVHLMPPVSSGDAARSSDPSTRLGGPLCALSAILASLIPLLGAQTWSETMQYLTDALQAEGNDCTVMSTVAAASSAHADLMGQQQQPSSQAVSPENCDAHRGRLLFIYAFFLFLCGDAAMLPEMMTIPTTTTATDASRPLPKGTKNCAEDAASPSTELSAPFTAVSPPAAAKHIGEGSLRFIAGSIRLDSLAVNSPRSPSMLACIHCVVALAPFAMESREVGSGISALMRFLVASSDVRQRLTAVVLMHDTCAALASEHLKVALLMEPLLPLLADAEQVVQEAALSALLFASTDLTEPRAQGRAIQPLLRAAHDTGCTSSFTRHLLQLLEQLTQRMPAEPREALLYPYLSELMDRLAERYVEHVSQEGLPVSPAASVAESVKAGGAAATSRGDTAARDLAGQRDTERQDWVDTMLVLPSLLNGILKCAVVTPTVVGRYLLPGIQQLSSEGVQSRRNPNVRSRWLRLQRSYLLFLENNSSYRLPLTAATAASTTSTSGTLLDRVKEELKRRL